MDDDCSPSDILSHMDEEALRLALDLTVRPILNEFLKRRYIVRITGDPKDLDDQGQSRINISITTDHPPFNG